jgi:hypothetical protein
MTLNNRRYSRSSIGHFLIEEEGFDREIAISLGPESRESLGRHLGRGRSRATFFFEAEAKRSSNVAFGANHKAVETTMRCYRPTQGLS